ncbi:MAG: 5'/3'-nucleotidase SurE [Bacteroidetes bacterium RIFOXYA12_FULL_35_11]|nr:MAG: 5'/3'-nucleotidase SurE [Bacteroidetes bacterium GWF2_35_48]OFY76020.1 MAG: 5'/3'-nucleotidase SurE [Bacteroidetes bacterium RIFOXYA12_FULL_35_11]OFY92562.1 MAG: 5'/3'-nucleotidase SurE [Bacteroidetes bacterium RIFOXYB2_FULL_35_7]OFY93771.1 MAG: 5'/3'-nucleotidase SurE [Bacteroidetes bacterium RIFOXYC12_FULL_35_7]HBX51441.1 5'/3'-nucleotidase SurE [Bacteroidales bacterium]
MQEKLILVSNDDGYDALGIEALIDVAKEFGRIVAVAPVEGRSGMSHAISIKNPLRLNKLWEKENVSMYSCSGTPVDSVKLALDQVLDRKPDLLVSGINHGSNASISIIYSGTMGAALEGCINGIPSIGFSVLDHSRNADFTLAKKYARVIIEKVLQNGLPENVGLNVNFPVIPENEFKGIKICMQTTGVWKEEFDKRKDPSKQDYYWLTGFFKNHEPENETTDEWALTHNYASVVPVKVDFTSYPAIEILKSWNL